MNFEALQVGPGLPWPLGAALVEGGVNFAVYSGNATRIELCLYSPDGRQEVRRIDLAERTGDVWHTHVSGLAAGQLYGLRAHGPHAPEIGHRFNPHKLLLDPHGKAISGRLRWSDALMSYRVGAARGDLSLDSRDSAFAMPRSQVVDDAFDWEGDSPPNIPLDRTVLYEAHVKSLTRLHPEIPERQRGTYAALGHPALIGHLQRLGVTALELLPVQAFLDDRFLLARGLRNHWGYNTIGFMAAEGRYGTLTQFKGAVKALHRAGIEVILDVVYNHTGEGDEWGPTLCHRGLDNAGYYRLLHGGRHYANDAGTGNTLDFSKRAVQRMVMDSLRYWVESCHVDGFRFDLATIMGRQGHGFDGGSGFFAALLQDPVLARVKLIAEPWDIGPGGYQLGAFPAPFAEWNDKYRDGVRRFWKGDAGMAPELARRVLGSAERFDHSRRSAASSVNFVAAHDGFTLHDVVSYAVKHNLANGEDNRDGHDDNHSANLGVEGPTDDPAISATRAQRKRALLATLMLSQGTPMLLAGDEIGHSQGGNNNAYAQDNEVSWLDWTRSDLDLADFVGRLTALRAAHPALRQPVFLHGRLRPDGHRDVVWRRPDGEEPQPGDWHDAAFRCFGVELRPSAEGRGGDDTVFVVFNGGQACRLHLPLTEPQWRCLIDSAHPEAGPVAAGPVVTVSAQSVTIFVPQPKGHEP